MTTNPEQPEKKVAGSHRLRAVRTRLINEGTAVAQLDGSSHNLFPIGISAAEGESLKAWVEREQPAASIEIGLAYAISTLFICEALLLNDSGSAHHVVIDPHQTSGFKNCGLQFLAEAGVEHLIEHHSELSQITLPKFLDEGRTFEFAFVDGSHFFEGIFVDLVYLNRLVHPGKIIFVDDFQLPAVARAVSFFVKNLGWLFEELSPADDLHQWAVLRTPLEPPQRTFRDFVDF